MSDRKTYFHLPESPDYNPFNPPCEHYGGIFDGWISLPDGAIVTTSCSDIRNRWFKVKKSHLHISIDNPEELPGMHVFLEEIPKP